ncbi:MAG TPA: HD domain-containing phosphohydrolase [Candidatus Saccharimonadaceae bacterium]|nr:HD domain-containing phosphohydrolase [Candidatus Saccharimonadaceae bacterium]
MSETPKPPPIDTRPTDVRYRDMGLQLILRLLAVIRIGRSYQVGNQVFRAQLEGFMKALDVAFAEGDEVVLVALESDIYLNGVRIPMKTSTYRHHTALLDEFKKRKIAGLRIEKDVTLEEMEKFYGLFMQTDNYHGSGLLEAAIAIGCDHVQPAVYASTESPDFGTTQLIPGMMSDGGGFYGTSAGPATFSPSSGAGGGGVGDTGGGPGGSGAVVGPGQGTGFGDLEPVHGGEPGPRGAAPKNYSVALKSARSLLTTTSLQDGMEMRHAKRVVQPLVDGAFESEPIVMGLSTLGHHDEYTYMHAVNVCMVAVTMGHSLGLDRRTLADLGVAALLHDVGKNAVGGRIRNPEPQWSEEERALALSHPIEGLKLMARSTALNTTTLRCMRVALEHHMGPGGYPQFADWTPSALSELVSVADCYVSLQTHRSDRGRNVTPTQALGMMLGPFASRFDPALLGALVQSVGLYPPGQMVELDDGAKALVLAPNATDPARPHLRVLMDGTGQWLAEDAPLEYKPLPADRTVRRALRVEEYPERPSEEKSA